MLTIQLISDAFAIAVISWIYTMVLVERDMILHGFSAWLYKMIGRHKILYKLIIGCPYCVAGQSALWYYIIDACISWQYNIFHHITLICFSIFFICIIIKFRLYGN